MFGLEAPNYWTRTRFLGVNPKDSTRTRLVLDTLRLVLDSYSQKVDSTHHYNPPRPPKPPGATTKSPRWA